MNLLTLLKLSIYISTGMQCLFQNVIKKALQFFCRAAFFTICTDDCLKFLIWPKASFETALHQIKWFGKETNSICSYFSGLFEKQFCAIRIENTSVENFMSYRGIRIVYRIHKYSIVVMLQHFQKGEHQVFFSNCHPFSQVSHLKMTLGNVLVTLYSCPFSFFSTF